MLTIDLNCDLGEGLPHDAALMPYISSANIACGGHAGDADTMRRTIELAIKHSVAIGAHPSFPDKDNFGRIDWLDFANSKIRYEELPAILEEQIFALQKICDEFGTRIQHVKPHGALYNHAAIDAMATGFICSAVLDIDPSLYLYGLSGSEMQNEAENYKVRFVKEVFADRTYQDDGTLTPRTGLNALIENEEQAVNQVLQMIKSKSVKTVTGRTIPMIAETICLHGDGKKAVEFARLIHANLTTENIMIKAPG